VDGIFCANDFMAAGAMNEAVKTGMGVPEKVRAVGFDSRGFTAFWPLPFRAFDLIDGRYPGRKRPS